MKRFGLILAPVLLSLLTNIVSAQETQLPVRTAPKDYTNSDKWNDKNEDQAALYEFKGRNVALLLKQYSFHTGDEIGEHVLVIYDVHNENPWIMMHIIEGDAGLKAYMFERNGESWVFVREILSGSDIGETFKLRFGLVRK